MFDDMLAAGSEAMPGIGSDVADPEMTESAYDGCARCARCARCSTDGLADLPAATAS